MFEQGGRFRSLLAVFELERGIGDLPVACRHRTRMKGPGTADLIPSLFPTLSPSPPTGKGGDAWPAENAEGVQHSSGLMT